MRIITQNFEPKMHLLVQNSEPIPEFTHEDAAFYPSSVSLILVPAREEPDSILFLHLIRGGFMFQCYTFLKHHAAYCLVASKSELFQIHSILMAL